MQSTHHYALTTTWKGNLGEGTSHVSKYSRDHTIELTGKPLLELTTDNKLYGDRSKLNPEDLLVAALSSCHMMSYLYLCAVNGVVVISYVDKATGIMIEKLAGGGKFKEVELHPQVKVADASMVDRARELHHKAHEICYIANSVSFEVKCLPVIEAS